MARILTGIQSSGRQHLGNILGAILPAIELSKIPENDCSLFFPPCILNNVNSEMRIAQTEIFGPVIALQTFNNDQEVIELANNTQYGLASYFYTKNLSRIEKVKAALQFGN